MPVTRRPFTAVALAGLALASCVAVAPGATAAPGAPGGPVVVTRGLDNPRQLSLLPDGSVLLIAEAGSGGPDCSDGGPGGEEVCVGFSGAISGVTAPRYIRSPVVATRYVTGLLSGAGPDGSAAAGSDGVSARSLQAIFTAMTFAPPDVLPEAPDSVQAGKLLRNAPYRPAKVFADITGYEVANDPDDQGVDSNPYAVLALTGGRALVADAAGNDILLVDSAGNVSLFATLPNVQAGKCAGQPNDNGTTGCDFVPTSLAQGPDGAIYVGGLGALTPGAGRVYKLDPRTGAVTKRFPSFLGSVTGVAVGPDNSLYVSQLSFDPSKGKVTKVAPDGVTRSDVSVPFPAGLAVDAAGGVYVSAFSIAPAGGLGIPGMDSSGQVWKIAFPTPTA